jgi:hypothetical protein
VAFPLHAFFLPIATTILPKTQKSLRSLPRCRSYVMFPEIVREAGHQALGSYTLHAPAYVKMFEMAGYTIGADGVPPDHLIDDMFVDCSVSLPANIRGCKQVQGRRSFLVPGPVVTPIRCVIRCSCHLVREEARRGRISQ